MSLYTNYKGKDKMGILDKLHKNRYIGVGDVIRWRNIGDSVWHTITVKKIIKQDLNGFVGLYLDGQRQSVNEINKEDFDSTAGIEIYSSDDNFIIGNRNTIIEVLEKKEEGI